MITYREAQQIVQAEARSFGGEKIPLAAAYGRVLGEQVIADRDYPPFNRATMDGYALRYADLQNGQRRFRVTETIYAGAIANGPISTGECYRIMTGAAVPDGADIVIRREDVQEDGLVVETASQQDWRPFLNIAGKGEDLRSGQTVIDRACVCEPSIIGLLASLGVDPVLAERLPRVALVTTGNEVVPANAPVSPVQIRNSNRWLIQSSLKKWQIDPFFYGHAPDDKIILQETLKKGLAGDILLCCGAVSAGDADFVPGVLTELGVQRLFHKMAIKPGKPVWCGTGPRGQMVFALPGNPFSSLVVFALLIEPYLRACFGLPEPGPASLPLEGVRKKRTVLDEFFPVRIHGAPARLQQVSLNGSGDIRLGLQANALALHPAAGNDLDAGTDTLYVGL